MGQLVSPISCVRGFSFLVFLNAKVSILKSEWSFALVITFYLNLFWWVVEAQTNTQTNKAKRLQPLAQLELLGIGFEIRSAISSEDSIYSIDSIGSIDSICSKESIGSTGSIGSICSIVSVDSVHPMD